MKDEKRRRAEILAEIERIPFAVQGKICENRKKLADGTTAVYHNLQWWADGRNHAIHIPEVRLPEFEEAVKGGRRVRELVQELSGSSLDSLLSPEAPAKKKSTRSASRAARRSRP